MISVGLDDPGEQPDRDVWVCEKKPKNGVMPPIDDRIEYTEYVARETKKTANIDAMLAELPWTTKKFTTWNTGEKEKLLYYFTNIFLPKYTPDEWWYD